MRRHTYDSVSLDRQAQLASERTNAPTHQRTNAGNETMIDHEILLAIQELLSGQEWTADTVQDIATLMEDNGYLIEDI